MPEFFRQYLETLSAEQASELNEYLEGNELAIDEINELVTELHL